MPPPSLLRSGSRRDFLQATGLGALGLALGRGLVAAAAAPAAPPPTGGDWAEMEAIIARIQRPDFPAHEISVAGLGAIGDGRTDARPAFMEAIRRCNAEGGGRVVVPAGIWWLNGPLHLKSRINLHLEAGATIRFNPDPKLYLPLVLTRWEGTEIFNYSPCIYAYQASHVAITGPGTIDGHAAELCLEWRKQQKPAKALVRDLGARGVPVHARIFGEGHWLRFPLIQFFGCDRVLLEDFTAINSAFWCIHTVASQHITVRRVRVDGAHLNNDCLDPESSSEVLVEDCVFKSGDDCIAIKSGRDQDGWLIGRPAENIVIRRCELESSRAAALAIGSEMSGGVRRVYVDDCRIGRARYAINFKGNLDRGGVVEQVRVRNVSVDTALEQFIQFTYDYQGFRGGESPPCFRDFVLENIRCREARGTAINFAGAPGAELSDITLRNITVQQAATPLTHQNARRLTFENVRIGHQLIPSPSP